jgi:hypothetical protein
MEEAAASVWRSVGRSWARTEEWWWRLSGMAGAGFEVILPIVD